MEDETKSAESGFAIGRYYSSADVEPDLEERLGAPGEFPFTRHAYPTGYRVRPWTPSLYSGFGVPEDANERFRYLLKQGNARANIAFDLPTQLGYDSDDPSVAHEVGRVGVAVDSLADFETLFDGIPLESVPVSMNVSAMAAPLFAMLAAAARKQGSSAAKLTGTVANDIAHEYVARGAWVYPVEDSLRLLTDTAEFALETSPNFYPFNIRPILLHELGASPPQEIAYSFSIAWHYLERLLDRGLPVDRVAPRMSFFFGVGLHFFEEAAKFRAARRLWARTLKEVYGAQSPKSQVMKFTSVAACGSYFTRSMPELNLVRGTLGTLGAALGGAQAMLGTTIDEAFDIPSEYTQLLALRTQQIVALESDVAATADPLGGSYFVESMTDDIERLTLEKVDELRDWGGTAASVESGQIQRAIQDRAYHIQMQIDSGKRPWVGVNVHVPDAEGPEETYWQPDPDVYQRRVASLDRVRRERSSREVSRALERLEKASKSTENLMPSMLQAVEAYATIGEISEVLRQTFGEFREPGLV